MSLVWALIASDIFALDSGSVLQHTLHSKPEETHYVFLLRDYNNSNVAGNTYHNGILVRSKMVIDLMGHTYTTNATGCESALRIQIKNGADYNVNFTFENGTILNTTSLPFLNVVSENTHESASCFKTCPCYVRCDYTFITIN